MIVQDNRQDGGKAQEPCDRHVLIADRQHRAEEVGVGIGMETPGADQRDGDAHGDGKDDGQDEVGIFLEILPEKFDHHPRKGGEDEGNEDRTLPEEKPERDTRQRRVRQGIPDHRVPFQHQEKSDAWAENGDADGMMSAFCMKV